MYQFFLKSIDLKVPNLKAPLIPKTVDKWPPRCHFAIESIKTTSIEDVSTRVLEKIKNI